MWSTTEPVLQV